MSDERAPSAARRPGARASRRRAMTILSGVAAVVLGFAAVAVGLAAAVLATAAVATALIAARIEAENPPLGRFVAVTGGRLSAIEARPASGARGTIVLLHGASASASDPLEGVGRTLADRGFRVLAFDRPGFGWSDRLAGGDAAAPEVQARAIGEALDRLDTGPVIVLGHSWAGALALRLALDRPDRVSGLVLAAPVAMPMPRQPLPWWAQLALQPPVTWLLTRTVAVPIGLSYLGRAAGVVFAPQPVSAGYVERSRAALILRPGPALANIQDLVGLPAALAAQAPRYGEIHVPTVVVAGDADSVVRTALQAAPLARAIPGAELVTLPGVGHMLLYVAAGAVADAAETLSRRIEASRTR